VPPREPTLKFIEKVIYSEKALIVSLCNGVTHKCVNKCFLIHTYFYFGYLSSGHSVFLVERGLRHCVGTALSGREVCLHVV
jgi:hypothetical protein